MSAEKPKTEAPPYISYATFSNFIKGLKETGLPHQVDKTVLAKMSGSGQAALLQALRWFRMIDHAGVPTQKLEDIVGADEDSYSKTLAGMLKERYPFITDGTVNLTKATGTQIEQKFRELGISGSTIAKSMAFFISACKDAGIALGPYVRTSKIVNVGPKRQSRKAAESAAEGAINQREEEVDEQHSERDGFLRIQIPLHGMDDGVVYLPDKLTPDQWAYALKITKFLLDNYRPDVTEGKKS